MAQAEWLFEKAPRPNVFVKIPGTREGVPAIEEAIFRGVPVNVTLLFSEAQYVAAAEAYMRGIERRVAAGLDPDVRSVASLFVSRWDKATADKVPGDLRNRLGIAVATLTYKAYRDLKETDRWQRLENLGARPQRLLFASTGTKDPNASDVLYVEGLVAPTPSTRCPRRRCSRSRTTARSPPLLPRDGGDAAEVVEAFSRAGIDVVQLAEDLQVDGGQGLRRFLAAPGRRGGRQEGIGLGRPRTGGLRRRRLVAVGRRRRHRRRRGRRALGLRLRPPLPPWSASSAALPSTVSCSSSRPARVSSAARCSSQQRLGPLQLLGHHPAHLGVDDLLGLRAQLAVVLHHAAQVLHLLAGVADRSQLLAHAELGDHAPHQFGGLLDVVAGPGADGAEHGQLGRPPAEHDGDAVRAARPR